VSNSRDRTKKGASNGAPSRASKGGRAARRKAGERGIGQRAGATIALVLVALMSLGGLGYWAQSRASNPIPPVLTPDQGQPTVPASTPPAPNQSPTPPPKAGPTTLPDGRPAAWAHLDRAGGASETMLQTLYWVDGRTGDRLQPVEVRLPKTTGRARAAVEQLLNAPANLNLYTGIPAGTKVVDVRLTNGVATVELSKEIESLQGSANAESVMTTLVYSLTELAEVKSVQLNVNGKAALLHGIEWSQPLTRQELTARNLFPVESVIRFDGP
jgi:hypothetical protein